MNLWAALKELVFIPNGQEQNQFVMDSIKRMIMQVGKNYISIPIPF